MALETRFRIVYLDECVVTKRTMPTHAWTLPKTNICFDQKQIYTKVKAVVVASSREFEVDLVEVYDNSITRQKFKVFLEELRRKYPFDDVMLVMDNLSLHKSKQMKNRMDELGFKYAWTPVYSPQYNGVEEVINIGKQVIKKKRLDAIVTNKEICLKNVIV